MSDADKHTQVLKKLDTIISTQVEHGKSIDTLNRVVLGDPVTKEYGLLDRQKADEAFQQMKIEEMGALRQSVDKLEKTIEKFIPAFDRSTKKLAEVTLWKDGIQASPKKAARGILWLSGFVVAVATLKDFVIEWFKELIDK